MDEPQTITWTIPPTATSAAEPDGYSANELRQWWIRTTTEDIDNSIDKIREYGGSGPARDLLEVGHLLAKVAGREVSDEEATELGVFFYSRSKFARWAAAILDGRRPSDDTLYDLTYYLMMARRARYAGGWPAGITPKEAKTEQDPPEPYDPEQADHQFGQPPAVADLPQDLWEAAITNAAHLDANVQTDGWLRNIIAHALAGLHSRGMLATDGELLTLTYQAWELIANAGWDAHRGQTDLDKAPGWHEAAIRWRDRFHEAIGVRPTTPTVGPVPDRTGNQDRLLADAWALLRGTFDSSEPWPDGILDWYDRWRDSTPTGMMRHGAYKCPIHRPDGRGGWTNRGRACTTDGCTIGS